MIDYNTFLGSVGPDTEIDLDSGRIADFARATLDSHAEHVRPEAARDLGLPGPVAPPTLAFVLTLGGSSPLPFPLDGFLHVDQALRFERPLFAGDRLTSHLELTRVRHRGGAGKGPDTWILSIEGSLQDASGRRIAQSESRLIHRDPAEPGSGPPARPDEARAEGEGTTPDPGPVTRTLALTHADLKRYAEASGDPNPIHTDDTVARRYGLPGVIAHGMLTMALLAQAAEEEARAEGDWVAALRCRFQEPVLPGETLSVHAAPGAREGSLALSLTGPGSPVPRVRGEATLAQAAQRFARSEGRD